MIRLNKREWIMVLVGLVAGLLIAVMVIPRSSHDGHSEQIHADEDAEYTCSMHPQIRQDEPGDCPLCGMDLIPVSKGTMSDDGPRVYSMSPQAVALANIRTERVTERSSGKEVVLTGRVAVNEQRLSAITADFSGRIERLFVDFTGQEVTRGQKLATIYSPELVSAGQELIEAARFKERQPQIYEAVREKLRLWNLTESQIDAIESGSTDATRFDVVAGRSGTVIARNVSTGDYVTRGSVLFEVADLSDVWVMLDAYESDITWIRKGTAVEFTVASMPGRRFSSTVAYIDQIINPQTRTAAVRLEVANANGNLKPDMFVTATIQTVSSASVQVPVSSVLWTGPRSVVYVKIPNRENPAFEMREVILGARAGDYQIILEGLSPGEDVVVNGAFALDAAAQLAGKPSMMSPEGAPVLTGHNHGEVSSHEAYDGNEKTEMTKSLSINKEAKNALQPLYNSYLKWKDALANDDFAEAQKMSTSMKSALDKINMNLFKGDAHNAWMDYMARLSKSLEHVQHFSDIEQLRKSFQTVSAAMIEMTNTFTPMSETIYVQHCPMADSNKGADWLSREKEIRNPYFGSSMLKCGEVIKEIK